MHSAPSDEDSLVIAKECFELLNAREELAAQQQGASGGEGIAVDAQSGDSRRQDRVAAEGYALIHEADTLVQLAIGGFNGGAVGILRRGKGAEAHKSAVQTASITDELLDGEVGGGGAGPDDFGELRRLRDGRIERGGW